MISFATEFPVSQNHTWETFLSAIRRWVAGSPHTRLRAEDLEQLGVEQESSVRSGDGAATEHLEALRLVEDGTQSVASRYRKLDRGLEWTTTIVFSKTEVESWVGIRVSCESLTAAARLPVAKKPLIVGSLLNSLGWSADGILQIQSTPHRLSNMDVDAASQLILGEASGRLPVVYVSADFVGNSIINCDQLAQQLEAMAHVVVEPNRAFSLRLKKEVAAQNVYGGTIGIYWPQADGRRSWFRREDFESELALRAAIVDEVQTALINRRPLERCTFAWVQGQIVRKRLAEAKADGGTTAVADWIQTFEADRLAREEQIASLERENSRLGSEVRRLEARGGAGSPGFKFGAEQALYPDELTAIIRDAVRRQYESERRDSRRQHVLSAFLAANPTSGGADENRERLKELLRGYREMDKKTRRGLEEMGFQISEEGKHLKLVFQGDDRYTFTLPKSGSDGRGGLNAASDIGQLLF